MSGFCNHGNEPFLSVSKRQGVTSVAEQILAA